MVPEIIGGGSVITFLGELARSVTGMIEYLK